MSFHDEYLQLLKLYNIDYDDKYVFSAQSENSVENLLVFSKELVPLHP